MDYYHNLVTEKSWQELQNLRRRLDFGLIGGWAAYLYTKTLKSKDIDIIIDYDALPVVANLYDMRKNNRLKKYEATKGEVQIDIYLPHYSQIGIPVEELLKQTISLEGFRVVEINYLIALKIFTFGRRGNSTKGRKDFIDTVSLLSLPPVNYEQIKHVVRNYDLGEALGNFIRILGSTFEMQELRLNKHAFAKLKKNIVNGMIRV